MKIRCLGCGHKEFSVLVPEVEEAKIITFVCPECGTLTAVQERPGGGLTVAVDSHQTAKRESST